MKTKITPSEMYRALVEKDSSYEGIFFVGVKTTGIFCRPSCRAKKPKKENVEFFFSTKDALYRGYRPCKVCHPMRPKGETPEWMTTIFEEISKKGNFRLNDFAIREMGIDPNRLRRWFKQHHEMTFQAYLRSLRLGHAFGHIVDGKKVIDTAFENGYESLSGFSYAFKKMIGTHPSGSQQHNVIHVYQILTPLGPMLAAAVKKGVCLLEFTDRRMLETQLKDLSDLIKGPFIVSFHPHLKELKSQLDEYFQGKRKEFSIPLLTPGTSFQQAVWKELQQIPYGQTRSYKKQAIALGNPQAVRAVARANGANRISILIPCHRVIGSNGDAIGYGGGIWRKKFLLDLETQNS